MGWIRGWAVLGVSAAMLLTGCRHKPARVITLPPPTPVPVAEPAPTVTKIPTIPVPKAPLATVKVPVRKVKKPHKKLATVPIAPPTLNTIPPAAPPPVAAPATAPTPLGTLTLGDGGVSEKQEAAASISSLQRRVAALPADLVKAQREQIGRVEHFAEEAERALKGGDAEGAQALAMKGKLILDDLLK